MRGEFERKLGEFFYKVTDNREPLYVIWIK